MEHNNVQQLVAGGGIGAVLVFVATVIGYYIRKTTIVTTANIDDRAQQNKDLMRQVDNLWKKIREMDDQIIYFRQRDSIFYRTFANISGEIRLLNGHMHTHMMELSPEILDRNALKEQCEVMNQTLVKMSKIMDSGEEQLSRIGFVSPHVEDTHKETNDKSE